jgi:hypothetical protein
MKLLFLRTFAGRFENLDDNVKLMLVIARKSASAFP